MVKKIQLKIVDFFDPSNKPRRITALSEDLRRSGTYSSGIGLVGVFIPGDNMEVEISLVLVTLGLAMSLIGLFLVQEENES